MNNVFVLMSDKELRVVFEEFQNHERTQVLQDGVLRNIIDELLMNYPKKINSHLMEY